MKHYEQEHTNMLYKPLAESMTLKYSNLSNGVMFPIYDPDTNLVYLCGKVRTLNYIVGQVFVKLYKFLCFSG